MRADLLAIERATLTAWRALEAEEIDGWMAQADGGVTGRPNAAAPLADARRDANAVARIERWYAARNQVPQFKFTREADEDGALAAVLSARGYCSHTPTLIMARSLRDAQFAAHDDVQLEAEPTPGFARVFSDARVSDADHDERWGLILRAPQPKAHAVIAIEGRPAAVGLCVVTGEQAGLYAMRTPPWARRRGLARRVVNACLAWATERSASHAYLQVEENNAAAIALYEGAGFRSCGRYAYWRPA